MHDQLPKIFSFISNYEENYIKRLPKNIAIIYRNYNKEIKIQKKIHYEKLYRKDHKYDYFILINYNVKKILPGKGSAIFIHLTKNYYPTAGCIALKKKDILILVKLINKKTKIKIY